MFAVIKLFQELFSPNRILRIISIHGNSNVPSTKKEKKKKKKKKRRKKGENKGVQWRVVEARFSSL